jgi:hypothetical protein
VTFPSFPGNGTVKLEMLIVLLFQSIENGTATELVTWRMAFGSSLIRALPLIRRESGAIVPVPSGPTVKAPGREMTSMTIPVMVRFPSKSRENVSTFARVLRPRLHVSPGQLLPKSSNDPITPAIAESSMCLQKIVKHASKLTSVSTLEPVSQVPGFA